MGLTPSGLTEAAVNPDEHILCIQCGYDLFGLDDSGRCPECGLSIARSRDGMSLVGAHLPWLETVQSGFTTFYRSVEVGVYAIGPLLLACPAAAATIVVHILLAALAVSLCAGVVQLTAQDPRYTLIEQPYTLRRRARAAAFAALALILIRIALDPVVRAKTLAVRHIVVGSCETLFGLALAVAVGGGMSYLGGLAARMGRRPLAREFPALEKRIAWALSAFVVATASGARVADYFLGFIGIGLIVPLAAGPLIALLWYMATASDLLRSYDKALRACVAEATEYRPYVGDSQPGNHGSQGDGRT